MRKNISLSELSHWKIGADNVPLFIAEDIAEIQSTLKTCGNNVDSLFVVGRTTNILFDSQSISRSILKLGADFDFIKIMDDEVEVGASSFVPKVVKRLCRLGYSGLEHAIGIPASIGGLVTMNGGSNRKSISENIISVKAMDFNGNILVFNKSECDFSYRNSIFKSGEFIILSANFKLDKSPYNRRILLDILRSRRKKFPLSKPNCGSVFISSPELYEMVGPPGKVIEELGLKGVKIGGAMVSEQHANFIVNQGNATSSDILELTQLIKDEVKNRYHVDLQEEYIYLK